jgi:hypothetical protein
MTKGKNNHSELSILSRDAFVRAAHLEHKEVVIPGIGTVLVRGFTGPEYIRYIKYFEFDAERKPQWSDEKRMDFNKYVVSVGTINPDGSKMFPNFESMPDLRPDVLRTLTMEIQKLSGLRNDDEVSDKIPNVSGTSSASSQTDGSDLSTKTN